MSQFWEKIRGSWINSLLFGGLLLAIFLIIFYLSNLNLKKNPVLAPTGEVISASNQDAEIAKRLGTNEFASLDYDSWATKNHLGAGAEKYDGDPDKDNLPNYLEYVHGTDPNNPDTDGDKFSDGREVVNGYDPDAPGDAQPEVQIFIPKINVNAPMVWSKTDNENDMLKDLENGVAHFAQTATPGQIGNAVISGHSSNYIWAAGNYNHIFKDLNNLEIGDGITVKMIYQNGRIITFHYAVADKFITGPDDAEIFAQTGSPTLTLSTCWPLGTALKRLIIKAEMVK